MTLLQLPEFLNAAQTYLGVVSLLFIGLIGALVWLNKERKDDNKRLLAQVEAEREKTEQEREKNHGIVMEFLGSIKIIENSLDVLSHTHNGVNQNNVLLENIKEKVTECKESLERYNGS